MEKENNFLKEASDLQEKLLQWRRSLHQMPETGIHLPRTMGYIDQQLTEMGIDHQYHKEISCIVAIIGQGDKCFLLRSDADGLPGTEETQLTFRSVNGCMHACGHDLHAAILLGAAKLLKEHEAELSGTVKLLFQSGEEVFQGAAAAIDAGVLESPRVDAAFAMHVIARMPVGAVVTGKAPMSSVDGFKITLTGRGGHGSMPESGIDPINAAVQVYLALQSLIAREIGGTEEAVLTIGQLTAGEVANVIPERAVLQGTLRTFDPKVRERLCRRIREVTAGVSTTYRCSWEYEVLSACPSMISDDAVSASVRQSIQRVVPQFHILDGAHGMGSEDFALIAQKVPSAYYMMGAGPEDKSIPTGQHNPKIEFNEEILPVGAAIYAQAAMDWLRK